MISELVVVLVLSLYKPEVKIDLQHRTEETCMSLSGLFDNKAYCLPEVDREIEENIKRMIGRNG